MHFIFTGFAYLMHITSILPSRKQRNKYKKAKKKKKGLGSFGMILRMRNIWNTTRIISYSKISKITKRTDYWQWRKQKHWILVKS